MKIEAALIEWVSQSVFHHRVPPRRGYVKDTIEGWDGMGWGKDAKKVTFRGHESLGIMLLTCIFSGCVRPIKARICQRGQGHHRGMGCQGNLCHGVTLFKVMKAWAYSSGVTGGGGGGQRGQCASRDFFFFLFMSDAHHGINSSTQKYQSTPSSVVLTSCRQDSGSPPF